MKIRLRKKPELFIPLEIEENTPSRTKTILRYLLPVIFLALVVGAAFFVDGSLLPGTDEKTYRISDEIVLPMVHIESLNPLVSTDEDTYYISRLLYDSLFVMDEGMAPLPSLALDYTTDSAKGTIVINLRQGVKWHDGKIFSAKDVVFTVNALKLAGDKSIYDKAASAIRRVKALDTYQVRIEFTSSGEMGLDLLDFPILPAHLYDGARDAVSQNKGFKPVGTGRYALEGYDPTTELRLASNPEYFGTVMENRLVFRVLPDKSNFFNLLKASNLSLIFSKDLDRASRISGEDVTSVDFPGNSLEYLGYNLAQPATAKKSLRKAIAYAIDIKRILAECYSGSGRMSGSLYYPGYLGIEVRTDPYALDISLAKTLVAKGGFIDLDGDKRVDLPDGTTLTLRILVNKENKARVLAANEVSDSLKKIGLASDVVALPWEEYLAALEAGEYDLYLGGIKTTPGMDFRAWLRGDGIYNFTGYRNVRLEEMMDQFRSGLDPERMGETYGGIRELLLEDMPVYSFFYRTVGAIGSPALNGDVRPLFTDYYRSSGNWTCQYEIQPESGDDE